MRASVIRVASVDLALYVHIYLGRLAIVVVFGTVGLVLAAGCGCRVFLKEGASFDKPRPRRQTDMQAAKSSTVVMPAPGGASRMVQECTMSLDGAQRPLSHPPAHPPARTSHAVRLREPAVRSDFDVYLSDNRLVYIGDRCSPAATEATFFLYLIPAT